MMAGTIGVVVSILPFQGSGSGSNPGWFRVDHDDAWLKWLEVWGSCFWCWEGLGGRQVGKRYSCVNNYKHVKGQLGRVVKASVY